MVGKIKIGNRVKETFHDHVPVAHKAKRVVGSRGQYAIVHFGERKILNLGISEILPGSKELTFKETNGKTAATFWVSNSHHEGWWVTHRYVEQEYRGYNLGKLGFGLSEKVVKQNGGHKISVSVLSVQPGVMAVLLSMGYAICPATIPAFKKFLKIPEGQKLPSKQKVLSQIRHGRLEHIWDPVVFEKKLVDE